MKKFSKKCIENDLLNLPKYLILQSSYFFLRTEISALLQSEWPTSIFLSEKIPGQWACSDIALLNVYLFHLHFSPLKMFLSFFLASTISNTKSADLIIISPFDIIAHILRCFPDICLYFRFLAFFDMMLLSVVFYLFILLWIC